MRFLFALLCLSIANAAIAQKPPHKFGDIPMEDMTMKVYPIDSSAKAVVLFDFGLTYPANQGASRYKTWYFERHLRVKVLKKEGLDEANLQNIVHQSQNLEELQAATYNLVDGKIVKDEISKENIFDQNLSGQYRTLKLTLPSVKEGSIVEFAFKLNSSIMTNWTFQNAIPARLSEYWMMAPVDFTFERKMQGYIPLDIYEENHTIFYRQSLKSYHFGCKNVPAFKTEPYLSSPEDYKSKIVLNISQFAGQDIMSSWKTLNDRLLDNENFGKAITSSDFLQGDVAGLITGLTTAEQKVFAISSHVKKNFAWNGVKTYFPTSLKKVYEKKTGSSADLNILLASMLEKAGLNVDMVLLSTRDHGIVVRTSAIASQFNYAICLVTTPEKVYFLDATERYLAYDVLPTRCLNGAGLRISKSGPSWMDISSRAKERTSLVAEMKLTDAGSLSGKLSYLYDGYDAASFRKDFYSKGKDEVVNQLKAINHWTISNSEIKDVEANEKSAQAFYDVEISEHANAAGDAIYVNPFVSGRIESNPFVSTTRLYPIDFPSKVEKIYSCKIVVPPGYVVEEAPQSKILTMPQNGARFNYNVAKLGDAINITSIFQINKMQFQVAEYELLREFYNQVVAKQAEQIVIKKK